MQPRWYQTEAVEAIAAHFATSNTNPAIILPTGAGKSLVIAMLAQRMVANGGRVAVFQHRAELIRQNAQKFQAICPVGGKKCFCFPKLCLGASVTTFFTWTWTYA